MSPRPPPKISLKHEWKRELGSEIARQPEGEVARQANFSNQPNQFQIQFVKDRGDLITCKMEETRPVLRRSMFILLAKSSVLQKERSDLLLLLIRLMRKTALEYVVFMKAIRSTLKMKNFVKEWQNPLLIMTRIMNQWWWTRQTWTSEFQDYHIPLWNTRKVPAFDNWFRTIENHPDRHALQQDLRQNQSFNPFSPESKQMIRDVGNIELCELLETEPKSQCTVCLSYWNIGILCCTCGHFLHTETGANQQFISYTMDLLSLPEYVIKKGRPHGHRYGKKPGDREYFTAKQLKKKMQEKVSSRESMTDSYEIQTFRSRMIENHRDEELCRWWDALADEDHTHHLTTQLYQSKWWLHSNKQGSNTVRLRHRSDFKQELSTLHRLQREAEGDPQVPTYSNRSQQWAQSSSSTWWNWQGSWWTPYPSESRDGDAPSTERTGWLDELQYLERFFWTRLSWIQLTLLQMDRLQLTAVYCNRRRCKHNTSNDPFSRCKSVQ